MRWLQAVLFVLSLPLLPLHWLICRLEARPCPACGEDFWTELVGEWDGEMWECRRCGCYWETTYKGEPK